MAKAKGKAQPTRDAGAAGQSDRTNAFAAKPRDPTPPANRVKFTATAPEVVSYPSDARAPSPLPSIGWDQRPGAPASPGKVTFVPSTSPERKRNEDRASGKDGKKGKGKGKGKGKKKGKGHQKGKVKGKGKASGKDGKNARQVIIQPSKDGGAHVKRK